MTNKKTIIKRLRAWAALCLPLAGGLALGGCSQDEESVGGQTGAVEFTTSITATRTAAGGNQWLATDEVGVFMLTGGGAMPGGIVPEADNVKFNPETGGAASTNLVPAGTAVYWPNPTDGYDFVAYYPWQAVGSGGINAADYTYLVDVSDQSKELDILYAKTTGKSSGSAVPFTFTHQMAKVRVNLTCASDIDPNDIVTTLNGMPTTAVLALTDGTLSGESMLLSHITMRDVTAGSGYDAALEAIVIPQAAGAYTGRTLKFYMIDSNVAFFWTVPDGDALVAGKVRTYNLTLGEGVTLTGSSLDDWTTTDHGNMGEMEPIEVKVEEEANSYMVVPNGISLIPVSQANRVLTADGLGAATTGLNEVTANNYTVELVWGDLPVGAGGVISSILPTLYNNKAYIQVESGVPGNAVIGIKLDGESTYRWSWHIWVTEAVTYKTDTETGLTWMDRNLGAAGTTYNTAGKNGLFYQWGRKDAFPGSDGTYSNNQTYYIGSSAIGTTAALAADSYTELPDMVRNPLVFATNYTTYYGSLNVAGEDNKSWSGNSGEKTLYDPCPPGWKMPPIEANSQNSWGAFTNSDSNEWTFTSYIGTNKGALFNGVNGTSSLGHFYPAAGRRNMSTGAIDNVGDRDHHWSTTTYSTTYGYSLLFYASGVYPNNTDNRTSGFSVRCVAE